MGRTTTADRLLTVTDVANILGVTTTWVYRAVQHGELPCVRIGNRIRFVRDDLNAWIDEQRANR